MDLTRTKKTCATCENTEKDGNAVVCHGYFDVPVSIDLEVAKRDAICEAMKEQEKEILSHSLTVSGRKSYPGSKNP